MILEPDLRETHRRLVHGARLLVAAERESGVTEVAAGRFDVPEPVAPAAPPVVSPAMPRAAPPATHAAAHPAAHSAAPDPFVPKVRPLDLPHGTLAPFGTLPDEVAACRACALCSTRTQTVFGEGTPSTRLVFCGEAPGADEDRSGRPFVGRAGELLTAMIEKGLQMRREEVFILNAIKCRPPENRMPLPAELAACRPFLERQLATIRPAVIVALGNPASRALLGHVPGIMTIRGKVFDGFGARIVPTFHPAYVLRNPAAKREVWTDLKTVLRLLGEGPE